jgi:hypothetical protein
MNKISKLKRDRDKQKHIYNKIVPNMIKLTHVPLLVFLLDEYKSQQHMEKFAKFTNASNN